MLFGKKFEILKELPRVYYKVGDGYPEYFHAYKNREGQLEYTILDENSMQPSPANYDMSPYADKLRTRSEEVLRELERQGYIKEIR